jgi:hypothetical protein
MEENNSEQPIMINDLRYTSRGVGELEKTLGKSVMEGLESWAISNLVIFIRKGLNNCDEETAFKALDQWRESGKDTLELLLFIIDILDKQGFLARALKLKEKIQSKIDKVAKQGM